MEGATTNARGAAVLARKEANKKWELKFNFVSVSKEYADLHKEAEAKEQKMKEEQETLKEKTGSCVQLEKKCEDASAELQNANTAKQKLHINKSHSRGCKANTV